MAKIPPDPKDRSQEIPVAREGNIKRKGGIHAKGVFHLRMIVKYPC